MTQRHSQYAMALGIAVLYAGFWLWLPIQFSQNDDTVMMMLASGEYSGTPSAYLVFINYYLGVILSGLYGWSDAVNWYPVLFVLLHALSIFVICNHVFFGGDGPRFFKALMCVLLVLVDAFLLVRLQFTTTTAIAMTGSIALMLSRSPAAVAVGGALMVLAISIRFEAAALVGITAAPFILYHLLRDGKKAVRFAAFFIAISVGLALHVSSQQVYQTKGDGFQEYNKIRGRLNDNPSAMSGKVVLPEGVGEHDFFLLLQFFQDENILTFDVMEKLLEAVEVVESDVYKFDPRPILEQRIILLVVPIFLICLGMTYRRERLVLLATAAILAACFIYISNTALLKERVVLAGFVPMLFILGAVGPHRESRVGKIALVVTLCLLFATMVNVLRFNLERNDRRNAFFLEQYDMIQQVDRPVVVFGGDYFAQGNRLFSNFKHHEPGQVRFRGWMTGHPDNHDFYRLDQLVTQDYVLLIRDKSFELLINGVLESLKANYGIDATYKVLGRHEYFMILDIVERKK